MVLLLETVNKSLITGLYFKSLYTPTESVDNDDQWKETISDRVQSALATVKPDKHVTVLPKTVAKAIESCPTGKAGGPDCILYENLKKSLCQLYWPTCSRRCFVLVISQIG